MAEPANELPAKSEEGDAKSPEKSREWEPFQTLRREIDRVFENFHHGLSAFGRTRMEFEPFRRLAGGWGSAPAVNMVEKDTTYELTAELPGMDGSIPLPESLDLTRIEASFKNGILTVTMPKTPE